ncbi:MAG: hypothetical protein RLZZ387_792 [Chloroflexota bacterium]|jgi:glycosyltransferase involved in cell wall biosynthesis
MSSESRRVLLLLPHLEVGGADKFNLDLAQQLARRGWRLTIALTLPGAHPWRAHFEAVTPDIVPLHPRVAPAKQSIFLRDLVGSRGIDTIIVSHSEAGYALLPYLRLHSPGLAVLDYLHIEELHWRDGGYPRLSLDAAHWLDMSVVSSEHLRGWMLARGADPARVAVCTTNIDTVEWDPAQFDRGVLRRDLGVAPDESLVLYPARLVPQKQPRLLADVARELARRRLRFTLLVAGDGPDRGWLESFVRSEGLAGQVRLLGAVGVERVRELMAAADIFLLPSQHEGISLALYEAMAMGLASVAADVGGQRELLIPECGVLVGRGPGERQAYVAALERLLSESELRARMGAMARRRVADHFRLDQMGERMAVLVGQAHVLASTSPRTASEEEAAAGVAQAVALARELERARRLWGYDGAERPGSGVLVLRALKRALQPAYRWALARDQRVIRLAVGARNALVRLLYRGQD